MKFAINAKIQNFQTCILKGKAINLTKETIKTTVHEKHFYAKSSPRKKFISIIFKVFINSLYKYYGAQKKSVFECFIIKDIHL